MDQMSGCDSEVQGWNLLTLIIYVFNVLSTSVENLLVVKVLKTHQSLLLSTIVLLFSSIIDEPFLLGEIIACIHTGA